PGPGFARRQPRLVRSCPPQEGGGSWGNPGVPHASSARSGRIDPLLEADGDLRLRVCDRLDRGSGARDRRDARNPCDEGSLADAIAVGPGAGALRRVDDEIDTASADQVDNAGTFTLLADLAHRLD